MEVHPPHEPVHTWREALIHIGLMTIGLFIALMLEGLVEYLHHKELVHHARENIRVEIERNHEALQKDIPSIDDNVSAINKGLDTMRFLQAHPKGKGSIVFHWIFSGLSDTAWRSARDTGALGYMPYDEVQRFAELYNLQSSVSAKMDSIATEELDAIAPLTGPGDDGIKLPDVVYYGMLTQTGATLGHIDVLKGYMQALDQSYLNTLKKS